MRLILFFLLAFTNTVVYGQGNAGVFLLNLNKEIEMTIFNQGDTVIGKQVYKITDVRSKGPETEASAFIINMRDGKTSEDSSRSFFIAGILSTSLGRDKEGKEYFLDYPSIFRNGEHLGRDIQFDVEKEINGQLTYLLVNIFNRQVTAVDEWIETPAGLWRCARITFDLHIRQPLSNNSKPMHLQVTEWFAPGFGVVKKQVLQDGQLKERALLTHIRQY